jgi:1-deoxy-D-xylulose-5-phosphate synthase
VAIRYPKGAASVASLSRKPEKIQLARAELLKEGKDFVLVSLGSMVSYSQEAWELLEKDGFYGTLINARFVKPLDECLLEDVCRKAKNIFTVEEGVVDGGFGCAVEDLLAKPVVKIGLPSKFIPHGKRELMLDKYGLTGLGIRNKIKEALCQR